MCVCLFACILVILFTVIPRCIHLFKYYSPGNTRMRFGKTPYLVRDKEMNNDL